MILTPDSELASPVYPEIGLTFSEIGSDTFEMNRRFHRITFSHNPENVRLLVIVSILLPIPSGVDLMSPQDVDGIIRLDRIDNSADRWVG